MYITQRIDQPTILKITDYSFPMVKCVDVNLVLGSLHFTDMGSVANVSEVRDVSNFRVEVSRFPEFIFLHVGIRKRRFDGYAGDRCLGSDNGSVVILTGVSTVIKKGSLSSNGRRYEYIRGDRIRRTVLGRSSLKIVETQPPETVEQIRRQN
jgi:hypothetical protein